MIYLDSAATTFQKPPSVRAAMQQALTAMSSLDAEAIRLPPRLQRSLLLVAASWLSSFIWTIRNRWYLP